MFHHQLAAILAAAALTLSANVYAAETPQPSEALSPVPFAAGVEKDGKWGALDASGKVVIPLSYDKEAVSLSDSEDQEADLASQAGRDNLIEVSKGKLRGFYNREGKVIVPVSYPMGLGVGPSYPLTSSEKKGEKGKEQIIWGDVE